MSKPGNKPGNRPLPPVETRWKPGHSGNPSGRPKGSGRLSKALAALMLEQYPGDERGRTYAEFIAEKLATAAAAGDIAAIRELADRTEGKATQRIENVAAWDRFERMSHDELMRYAETGNLPEWWEREASNEPN